MKQNETFNKHGKPDRQRRDSLSALLRPIRRTLGILLIFAGIGIIGSSLILNFIQVTSKRKAIEEFRQEAAAEPSQITLAQPDPNPETAGSAEESQERFSGNIMGILRIPSIDSEEPVKEGVTRSSLT